MAEEGGGGEPSFLAKMGGSFQTMCLGMVLFPVSLLLIGYNEKSYMCVHKNILYASEKAEVLNCHDKGHFIPDMVAYVACPIKEDSLMHFTPDSFGSASLGDSIQFRSVAGAQKAEMFQCVQSVREEVQKDKTKIKVYSYRAEWRSSHVDSSGFATTPQAMHAKRQGCPGFTHNPAWPQDVPEHVSGAMAHSIQLGPLTVGKDLLSGGGSGFGGLHADMSRPIPLQSFAHKFKAVHTLKSPPVHGYASIAPHNTAIGTTGSYIITCSDQRIGCVRISYYKNWDTGASVISAVQGGQSVPVDVPASWGCSADKYDALSGGVQTLQAFSTALEEANTTSTWIMRFVGLCFAWITVYCCFQPIAAAADGVGDCLRMIPCAGMCLEDMLEGVVGAVLCVVSCCFGCSCGLLVLGIVWLVMRPLIGSAMVLICGLLCAGAYFLAKQSKTNNKANDAEGERELLPTNGPEGA
ncbi:unnamed protein product [Symbiodinium natans]|uniref:Transmembrane protein n=1 Tax=Symbiodinium natans TaxID=878477 RepID=A0A812T4P9_9DINO|nr:unnamed protein product [Symbiodinium natans]